MVRIRLTRVGKKNQPSYRIGVFDARTRRDGRTVEIIGRYDPRNADAGKQMTVERERVSYWIEKGAQPSETVASILKKMGFDLKSKQWKTPEKAAVPAGKE